MHKKINIIKFYFDNACKNPQQTRDEMFSGKVETYIKKQRPKFIWYDRGMYNPTIEENVFPDMVALINGKLIACELVSGNLAQRIAKYDGISLFDEIWFFTQIPLEKKHLHYKCKGRDNMRFFGIDNRGRIGEIESI